MNFEEALSATAPTPKLCKIAMWLDTIDDKTRAQITQAIDEFPTYRVFRACQLIGLTASESSWTKHMSGVCPCRKN